MDLEEKDLPGVAYRVVEQVLIEAFVIPYSMLKSIFCCYLDGRRRIDSRRGQSDCYAFAAA